MFLAQAIVSIQLACESLFHRFYAAFYVVYRFLSCPASHPDLQVAVWIAISLSLAPESGHSGRTHTGIETRSSLTRSPLNVIYSRSRSGPELVGVHLVPGNWIAGNSSCHCCLRVRRGSSSSADASSKKYRTGRGREKAVEEKEEREEAEQEQIRRSTRTRTPCSPSPDLLPNSHKTHTAHFVSTVSLVSSICSGRSRF